MVFSSMFFIFIFLPFVSVTYYLLKFIFPNKISIRNLFLCIVSLFFYAWGEPVYIFLMLSSILINYIIARKISKLSFIIAIIFNLSFLLVFKYTGFFITNVNTIFGLSIKVPQLTLPIGISFYTFQALSYIIDVYRKKIEPQKSFLSLALYISFFPQLIAGPIVRYIDIEKELSSRSESFTNFIEGLKLFMLGFATKVILANNLASVVDGVYGNFSEANCFILWCVAIAYSLQIYFDFSGYSKMAIGLGKMFGFNFPENFNYPYIASSITDFWRRWHITLSVWFRDYVYIPLGGNRVKPIRHIFNILFTWLLTGFWHGASWNFILWGIYYGVLLLLEKYIFFKNNTLTSKRMSHPLNICVRILSIFFIIIGWVIFRIENIHDLGNILYTMFSFTNQTPIVSYIVQNADICSKLIFIIPGIIFSLPVYKKIFAKNTSSTFVFTLETIFIFILYVISLCLLVASTYNPFIYFRF